MLRLGLRFACLGLALLSILVGSGNVLAESPQERVQAELGVLQRWLQEGKVADDWRPVLLLDQLELQLARGAEADRSAVAEVLARFGADDPGLSRERFVRLRQAVEQWLVSLPNPAPGELAAAARAAKAVFLPPTPVDVEDAKAELLAALDRLDEALKSPIPGERDWKALLLPGLIREQFSGKEGPDLSALDAAYLRFASGSEGLGRVCFLDVRNGLRRYLTAARFVGDRKLHKQYEILLEALAVRLEKYVKEPSAQLAEEIDLALDWLDQARQAPWIVKAVGSRLSHPNLFVEVSSGLIASRVAEPVDDTTPVRDCILKTDIHGTARTTGNLSLEMVPSSDRGQFDLIFQGNAETENVGYHGPVQVFASGVTRITARKRVRIDHEKIEAENAESEAETSTSIDGVSANSRLLEKIACRRAEKQRPKAECIASQHAEERFNEQMDARAAELLAKANERYTEKFRRPLLERRLFPESLRFSTSARALRVTAMQIAQGSLAAPGAPPKVDQAGDVSVCVHQSIINNVTGSALGGMTLDEKRFQQILVENLGAPKRPAEEGDDENWAITFAPRQPISVVFGADTFTVTIRGRSYANEGKQYPGMNVTATYKIDRSNGGLKAVRQGRLVVVPPGFKLESGQQLSAREQFLRKVLEHRFGKIFEPEMKPKNLVLAPEGRTPLELQLSRWEAADGWLVLGWKQVPPSKSVAAAEKPSKTNGPS